MKINSLLDETLFEHLGNLDKIDKELIKPLVGSIVVKKQLQGVGFKKKTGTFDQDEKEQLDNIAQPGYYKSKESHATVWDDGKARTTKKLKPKIGRDSAIDETQLKVAEAIKAIEEDANVAGLVYKVNGKQVLLITHDLFITKSGENAMNPKGAGYKQSLTYSWVMTKAFSRELLRTDIKQKYPPANSTKTVLSELTKCLNISQANGSITSRGNLELLFKTLAMREWLLANPDAKSMPKELNLPELNVLLIRPDLNREEVIKQRKEVSKGMVPVPKTPFEVKMPGASYSTTTHNVYIKNLFSHLSFRLNQLKNKRAGAFDNPAEMLEHIIKEGYIKKLKFMDAAYNLKNNRIEMDDLMLGKHSKDTSYLEYVCETSLSYDDPSKLAALEEYKQLRNELMPKAPPPFKWVQEKIDAATSDEEKQKLLIEWQKDWAYNALKPKMSGIYMKHKCPPSKILVKFVLEGGKIVPHHLDMNYDHW